MTNSPLAAPGPEQEPASLRPCARCALDSKRPTEPLDALAHSLQTKMALFHANGGAGFKAVSIVANTELNRIGGENDAESDVPCAGVLERVGECFSGEEEKIACDKVR